MIHRMSVGKNLFFKNHRRSDHDENLPKSDMNCRALCKFLAVSQDNLCFSCRPRGVRRILKPGFHIMGSQTIADHRSQNVLRSSAIIWKHPSAIVCDPAIMIADDRRR